VKSQPKKLSLQRRTAVCPVFENDSQGIQGLCLNEPVLQIPARSLYRHIHKLALQLLLYGGNYHPKAMRIPVQFGHPGVTELPLPTHLEHNRHECHHENCPHPILLVETA
jgi:hypothetical protein